jgi:hypothetical protein
VNAADARASARVRADLLACEVVEAVQVGKELPDFLTPDMVGWGETSERSEPSPEGTISVRLQIRLVNVGEQPVLVAVVGKGGLVVARNPVASPALAPFAGLEWSRLPAHGELIVYPAIDVPSRAKHFLSRLLPDLGHEPLLERIPAIPPFVSFGLTEDGCYPDVAWP